MRFSLWGYSKDTREWSVFTVEFYRVILRPCKYFLWGGGRGGGVRNQFLFRKRPLLFIAVDAICIIYWACVCSRCFVEHSDLGLY